MGQTQDKYNSSEVVTQDILWETKSFFYSCAKPSFMLHFTDTETNVLCAVTNTFTIQPEVCVIAQLQAGVWSSPQTSIIL